MSVVDPIRIGSLTLTPSSFQGTTVTLRLEEDGPVVGEERTLVTVQDSNAANATPVLDIRTWESLQAVAAYLAAPPVVPPAAPEPEPAPEATT